LSREPKLFAEDDENGQEQDEDEGRVADQYGGGKRVHRIRSVTREGKCNAARIPPQASNGGADETNTI
jgi:hypothetical protein